jgi:phosphoribosylglycinamide formyltransferase-1
VTPLRVALLASGRGSHFASLALAAQRGELPIAMAGVFSDKPNALVLQRAAELGVASSVFDPKAYADRGSHERALFDAIDATRPDLIVCAGYMRILGPEAVQPRSQRMLNIHPSLLPRHRGLHTHRRALEASDTEHGASVHFVTTELDGGPVLAQARIAISPGDDEATLADRVLTREHPLLRACVARFAAGDLALSGDTVLHRGVALQRPLQLGDDDRLHPG